MPVRRANPEEGPARYKSEAAADRARDVFSSDLGWVVRTVFVPG